MLKDFDLASKSSVDANLWKLVHYKLIEEFRKHIKSSLQKAKSTQKTMDDKKEWRNLSNSFRTFLTDATGFYLTLVQQVISQYQLHLLVDPWFLNMYPLVPEVALENPHPELVERVILFLHKCWTYLGDLARYREVHSDKKQKHWGMAKRFYTMAIQLIPEYGNPYNQLAVIETYQGHDLDAIYMCLNSYLVKYPFPTASENLSTLLLKGRVSNAPDGQALVSLFIGMTSLVFGTKK